MSSRTETFHTSWSIFKGLAAKSDGTILLSQFQLDIYGCECFRRGDIFILNCGYREISAILENLRIISKMPSVLRPNES